MIANLRDWFWYNLLQFKKAKDAFFDHCRPDGHLQLEILYASGPRKGEVYRVLEGRNVVTSWQSSGGAAPTSGRDMIRRVLVPATEAESLAGDADATIQTCRMGSGTTAELSTDTGLESEIGGSEKVLTSVEFDPANPYVTFLWEYGSAELNTTISEFGVYSGRGDFFARKTFPSFTNTSDFALRLRYTLKV